jgi:hypothetical protein
VPLPVGEEMNHWWGVVPMSTFHYAVGVSSLVQRTESTEEGC